jgi:hypothetical protein
VAVTKSHESGDDSLVDEVRREAQRTGEDPGAILRRRRQQAKQDRDKKELRRINRAEKYLGYRNRRKRGKRRK